MEKINLGLQFGFLVVGGMCLLIGMSITNNKIIYEEVEIEKQQPMLLAIFDSWGENIDDSSEAIFSYFVYNFGNVEIKNVMITCEITNIDDILQKKETFNIGNMASNSNEYQESYMDYWSDSIEEFGICYLESADGDYINLKDRLNDIQ